MKSWFKKERVAEAVAEELTPSTNLNEYHFDRIFQTSTISPDRIAAVFACANVISSSIAAMPLSLYKKTGKTREKVVSHRMAEFLADAPNKAMGWQSLREMTLFSMALRGRHYWRVYRAAGHVVEVFPVHVEAVSFKIEARRARYKLTDTLAGVKGGNFTGEQIAHFRNLTGIDGQGISPIEHCAQTVNSAGCLQTYGEKSAANGQPLKGVVTGAPPSKNPEVAKKIRSNWRDSFKESQQGGDGVVILEGERMQFQAVSMSMRDAQFIEQMKFSVIEIARIYNVPPHKIQELENATYSNIEHQSLEFYTSTLIPWVLRFEEVLNQTLLTTSERAQGYYFHHNADGLLRGDLKTRMEANSAAIMSGQVTPNEARALEEREGLEGGDRLLVGVNQTPLETLGDPPQ